MSFSRRFDRRDEETGSDLHFIFTALANETDGIFCDVQRD